MSVIVLRVFHTAFEILVLLVSFIDVLISWYQDEVMVLVLALIRGWYWEWFFTGETKQGGITKTSVY